MTNKERIEQILQNQELTDYKWINPKEIVVAHWVRVKCQFGCPDYGLGTCPPNTPSVDDCDKFFKEYESALIIWLNKSTIKSKI
jgi:predicted metal-binding protein